ncbi:MULTISPECIES: HEAT repeat domain-containing protein [Paenibacillus]|uniref:HEAT repeat domain-containing protein n=1 Tax=Paenibacillus TaxID=44249 RepID=UPI00036A215F|nr:MULTISPECIES: HEAT repeat domain-containing protein [Paenibacillus]
MTTEDHSNTQYELPENYNELKKAAHRTADWQQRLHAAQELGQYDLPPVIDLLQHLMNHDPVTAVRVEAHKQLRGLGQDVQLPERHNTELFNHMTKTLIRIKKSLPREHTYEDFKDKLNKMRADIYNAYEGEKGEEFDSWLRGRWESLDLTRNPKKTPKTNTRTEK